METIFISSVQKELAEERRALKEFIEGDPLLRRFFDVFLFEDLPAADRRADDVYIGHVDDSAIYLGILGDGYGYEDAAGISPTEREFNRATERGKTRLVFVKGTDDQARNLKMTALIRKAGDLLIRRRFSSKAELVSDVYSSLVQYLGDRGLIRHGPYDASFCRGAGLNDLDDQKIEEFVRLSKRSRGFPLPEDSAPAEVLTHLNLLDDGRPSHASVLLFGKQPQRFMSSSEVKCAHFHGTEAVKPIPSYQVYRGTVFEVIDLAIDFVMSRIDRWIGTRSESAQAPTIYEIPREVVAEAIVNAVSHRDYASHGSVQVMLFADRLEVWNPGTLPSNLTLEGLRGPHGSIPHNPLLAVPLYLTKYIERMGTGTRDMIARCREAGLPEPEFALTDGFVAIIRRRTPQVGIKSGPSQDQVTQQVESVPENVVADIVKALGISTPQVTQQVARQVITILLAISDEPSSRAALQERMGLKDREHFRKSYLEPMVNAGLISMTVAEKPHSRMQRYELTERGREILSKYRAESG